MSPVVPVRLTRRGESRYPLSPRTLKGGQVELKPCAPDEAATAPIAEAVAAVQGMVG